MLHAVNGGTMSAVAAASYLGTKVAYVQERARLLSSTGKAALPDKTGGAKSHGAILTGVEFTGDEIKWAKFYELDKDEAFRMPAICAMFYASERIVSFKGMMPMHMREQFSPMKERAQAYIDLWAERFAKYSLAACLGEFRLRRRNVGAQIHGISRRVSRKAAQGAATVLWPDKQKTIKAMDYMAERFASSDFPGSGYGGKPWARIAKTANMWLKGEIPSIVWGDYVWDLSHNGGCFFDKCSLFHEESDCRKYLDIKRNSKVGSLEWARPMLHPDWVTALDLVEFAEEGAQP